MTILADRTLALAGVFQSARLVQRFARTNTTFPMAFAVSIFSVLKTDSDSTLQVFGSDAPTPALQIGLEAVRDKLGGNSDRDDFEVARYVAGMIELTRKLNANPALMKKLSDGIDQLALQYPPDRHWLDSAEIPEPAIEAIAKLYTDTVSTLTPRILVDGEENFLKQDATVNRIRASLMAGIRATHLWWQLGGRRWQLLFRRGQLADTAGALLKA